jgi:hypothetical protein
VRRAIRKEKELQEKLEFYNMKLIGYKGVSYDRIGSSGSRSSGDSEVLFWLDKIDQTEKQIALNNHVINEFKSFVQELNITESIIINELLFKGIIIKNSTKKSKSNRYRIINSISVKLLKKNHITQ